MNGVLGRIALKFRIFEEISVGSDLLLLSSLRTNLGSNPGRVRKKKGASGVFGG
jgi:hypothetical protein